MAESEHDKQHLSKFFSRREASFHLNDVVYVAAQREAVSRKTCVSPPKFHYAKNSDESLSGRFSQQRLRESSRVSSPWRRGYFSGLTQVFPHHRLLTAASEVHWQVEAGFPAIFTLQDSQCVLPFQFQCQLRRSVTVTVSNLFILAVYFLCTSDSYIFLSCSILHLLRLSYIISHKLNYALPGSMFSFSRSIYVIYLSMVGLCHSFNCQNHVSLLLMACKPLSIKLQNQGSTAAVHNLRMPKESGTSGEISFTPRRWDPGWFSKPLLRESAA